MRKPTRSGGGARLGDVMRATRPLMTFGDHTARSAAATRTAMPAQ